MQDMIPPKDTQNIKQVHQLAYLKYRPDIDGLRAIAVFVVIIYHAFPTWLESGFIGVDIFFVISGFLISTIIFTSLDKGSFSFKVFYARRINRIFPALLLVLIVSLVFGWFALFPDEYQQLGKHVLGGSSFIFNFILWNESGYFDTSAEIKPLLHLWSLGIEEQFYIVWPVLVWGAWKYRINCFKLILVIILISMFWNISCLATNPVSAFYLPFSRAWELLVGAIFAYINLYNKKELKLFFDKVVNNNMISAIGVLSLGYGLFSITSATPFPGWSALFPVLGALLIIAAGQDAWFNKYILSNRLSVGLGMISYPLYLWHWPLLSFARIIESGTPVLEIRMAAVSLAIVLAWLTYQLLEKPLKFSNFKYKTHTLIIVMVITGVSGHLIYKADGVPMRESIRGSVKVNSQFVGPLWKYTNNSLCLNKYPLKGINEYSWWFCMMSKDESPTILLLGNSFANHLYPGLAKVEELHKHNFLSIGTCRIDTALINSSNDQWNPCAGDRALNQRQLIKKIIEESKTVKYAIIDGLNSKQDSDTILRVQEFIEYLKTKNVHPIIFIPHITVDHDLKGCFSRPFKSPKLKCELSLDIQEKITTDFYPLIQNISSKYPEVLFFDQNKLFCDEKRCSLLLNGMPIFRDEYSHYSEYASEELAKLFVEWMKANSLDALME